MSNEGCKQQNKTSTQKKKNLNSKQEGCEIAKFLLHFDELFLRDVMGDKQLHFTAAPKQKRGGRRRRKTAVKRKERGEKGTGPRPL